LDKYFIQVGKAVEIDNKTYCPIKLDKSESIIVPPVTLKKYGIEVGDFLLAVRGSHLAISFIVRGPITEEAKKHPELLLYE
jgi:hypothetical protein